MYQSGTQGQFCLDTNPSKPQWNLFLPAFRRTTRHQLAPKENKLNQSSCSKNRRKRPIVSAESLPKLSKRHCVCRAIANAKIMRMHQSLASYRKIGTHDHIPADVMRLRIIYPPGKDGVMRSHTVKEIAGTCTFSFTPFISRGLWNFCKSSKSSTSPLQDRCTKMTLRTDNATPANTTSPLAK